MTWAPQPSATPRAALIRVHLPGLFALQKLQHGKWAKEWQCASEMGAGRWGRRGRGGCAVVYAGCWSRRFCWRRLVLEPLVSGSALSAPPAYSSRRG